MQLYLVPRCQRPATCRLHSKLSCTARARPFRDIGCTDRPRHRTVRLHRQLRSSALAASAGDTEQVDHAAVGPFRQLGLWTAVDAAATVGSIVGALAFFITSEAVFASIPVVLPLVAWYAGRQKEGLQVEAAIERAARQWPVQSMTPTSAADSVAAALQQLQRDSQQQQLVVKHVKSIEAKLNALEGSVVTAGMNAQDAARQVSSCSDQVAQRTQAQIKDFSASIQSNGLTALQRLDARLTTLGNSLARLEKDQGDGMERGQQKILDAMSQYQSSLQDAVERGSQEASDATRALPDAMTAALSAALQRADQPSMLPSADQPDGQPAFQVSSLANESQQQLRLLVSEELAQAVQQINSAQAQPPQSAVNQAVLDRLSQIEQRLQRGVVSSSSSEDKVQMPEVLQAMQDLEARLLGSLDQKIADLDMRRDGSSEGSPLSAAAAPNTMLASDGFITFDASMPSTQSMPQQQQGEEEEDCRQAAYERMQALLESRNNGNFTASTSGQDDQTPRAPRKERSTDRQSGGSDSSDNMQPPSSPSSVQQQFAFAAGLAAAEDMPIATPESGGITQLSRVNSWTESEQLPAQQQQQEDEKLDKQSSTQSAIQSEPESSSIGQFDGQSERQINGQSSGQSNGQASGQTHGQTDGQSSLQTNGQTDRQTSGQTSVPEGQSSGQSNGQASMPQGQLPGKKSQQDVQLDPREDPAQQLVNQQQASISQPDQSDKYEAQRDMGAPTSAKRTGSSEAISSSSSSSSNTAVGDDSSSAEAEVVEMEQMSFSERLQAGLDCFRAGRAEAQQGSLGDATQLLTSALSYYEAAAEQNSGSTQLLGNWGNALLAYGSLKKKVLSAVSGAAAAAGPPDQSAVAATQAQITQEASAALIAAGQKFQAIAQQDIKNTSALHNWAKSICIRASLKDNPEEAMRLYSSAIDKCDQVLEIKPRDTAVLVTFGLALKDMALCMTLNDPDVQLHLADALDAFQQALEVDPTNKAANVGQAECNDRMRICQKYKEQAGSR